MPLTNPNKVVTEERLNEYHKMILPYLGGNSMVACGGGYAPIGTIIQYMGTTAPQDYLICDGTVYNIADYSQLADFFEAQFGTANYFGGDGTTTFAVPDLRGEFLRGTGKNSHENQGSGANVGVHQDGSESMKFYAQRNNIIAVGSSSTDAVTNYGNYDSSYKRNYLGKALSFNKSGEWDDSSFNVLTSRPTNTSVLFCIKAVVAGEVYSTEERVVGTWIDGKKLYQKTISGTFTSGNEFATFGVTLDYFPNVENVIGSNCCGYYIINSSTYSTTAIYSRVFATSSIQLRQEFSSSNSEYVFQLTLKYTKTTD